MSGTAVEVVIGSEVFIGVIVTIVDEDSNSIKADGRRYNSSAGDLVARPVRIHENERIYF